MPPTTPITYKDAGVDIEAGEALVERIKPAAKRTMRPEVLGGLGGFGALFELDLTRWRKPVLVAGTDGVGTKLRLAIETGRHETIGVDLVAMCVNDVVVQGAEPLFFLDYYATGKLSVDLAATVIDGIAAGCMQAGVALIGGETAEMPGMYAAGDYDLAGFCVGVVEKDSIIDGRDTRPGDVVLGLPSSGPHSNGYSLIRKLIAAAKADAATKLPDGQLLFDALLAPTRIYVKALLALARTLPVRSFAHITGGGLTENIPRVVPEGCEVVLDARSWTRAPVFEWLQKTAGISDAEMHRTFNCGVGMTVCVAAVDVEKAMQTLRDHGEAPLVIGEVRRGDGGVIVR
ncbi:MAG TPA: phosphoribosylformylglycinamidine cyclo-ligase [Steroidobacter sp.]|jgi:phosphoribosylformylglycinamidine cyclo-ligase|nr:phosphoribosylformylglycinamidine cyclo-ligase [Steroidobacteraceae bacterium]HLS81972.1 phosphoribosylformylglycinamidine cyclo-ligase [Steroidobacter sp.]